MNIKVGNGKLITLFIHTEDITPLSIICDIKDKNAFINREICLGMQVTLSRELIGVPQAGFICDCSKAVEEKTPKNVPERLISYDGIEGNLNTVLEILKSLPDANGACSYIEEFGGLYFKKSLRERKGLPNDFFVRLGNLAKSAQENNPISIFKNLYLTVGMGIGLTPSADDVILGISAWLYFYPGSYERYSDWFESLKSFVKDEGEKRTTFVSKIYLEHGSSGRFSEVLYKMIFNILCKPREDVSSATYKMISYGASSGCDICTGVLIGGIITSQQTLAFK
jgi:hypothetical protein